MSDKYHGVIDDEQTLDYYMGLSYSITLHPSDPDDVTPAAIKGMGAKLITYGAPVLPGAMFMLAYLGVVPIIGLPGCVMYSKKSIFDLLALRMLTGERLSRLDIVKLGMGGLCLECPVCTYPRCSFGK